MTTRTFKLPWSNADIDIHPDPEDGWHRVAVVGGWQSATKIRKKWPHAAVVGPLRTQRGIDLLVRALLANPQIRLVIWDGPDLTAGQATRKALFALWASENGKRRGIGVDLLTPEGRTGGTAVAFLITACALVQDDDPTKDFSRMTYAGPQEDGPGGPIILPPPAPKATASVPHGDPGMRIVGNTLAEGVIDESGS